MRPTTITMVIHLTYLCTCCEIDSPIGVVMGCGSKDRNGKGAGIRGPAAETPARKPRALRSAIHETLKLFFHVHHREFFFQIGSKFFLGVVPDKKRFVRMNAHTVAIRA